MEGGEREQRRWRNKMIEIEQKKKGGGWGGGGGGGGAGGLEMRIERREKKLVK